MTQPQGHFSTYTCIGKSSNVLFSETNGPFKTKFYMESQWVVENESCFADFGSYGKDGHHAMYDKNL